MCARMHETHPPLQTLPLPQCQCVSLGDHWDNVDFAVDGLHKFHVQRLQTNNVNDNKGEKTLIRIPTFREMAGFHIPDCFVHFQI